MKKKKSLYLLIAFVAVIAGAFGYAAMSRTLTINGSAVAGPDSNNFKVFYSDYAITLDQSLSADDHELYASANDIIPGFVDASGSTITNLAGGSGNLDGKNAVAMVVDLPWNTLLHVGDKAVINFKIKNYGSQGYASAKLENFPPQSISQTYTTCAKTSANGTPTVNCTSTADTITGSDPFTITIEPDLSGWSPAVPQTAGTTYGTMNPGEYVAYNMTITYANEVEKYVQAHYTITYNAVETAAHS